MNVMQDVLKAKVFLTYLLVTQYRLRVFVPVMPELFARQVFCVPLNIPTPLSVYRSYALFSTTPQYRNVSPPPFTRYINLEIFTSPVISSYFVGNYFNFDTFCFCNTDCKFSVQGRSKFKL